MAPLIEKRYLGDSVYAAVETGMIKLTTENGMSATNTIYLEPGVYRALVAFYEDVVVAVEWAVVQRPSEQDTGLCCLARHATAKLPWTCDCSCHQQDQ